MTSTLPKCFSVRIDAGQVGKRCFQLVRESFVKQSPSKSTTKNAFRNHLVLVNGVPVEETRLLKLDDEVTFIEQPRLLVKPSTQRLLYQDDAVAVVSKEAGQSLVYYEKVLGGGQSLYKLDKAASGLLVICLTEEVYARLKLAYLREKVKCEFQCLVHGALPEYEALALEDELRECAKGWEILQRTPSTATGVITTVRLEVNPLIIKTENTLAVIKPLRKALLKAGYPVIGESDFCRPLPGYKDKGLLMALVRLDFPHRIKDGKEEEKLSFQCEEPAKFHPVRERELKFYDLLIAQNRAKLPPSAAAAGDDDVWLPIPYLTGEKEFDGLSFKVDSNTLIPRDSSTALVDAVTQIILPHIGDRSLRVLDIGTGCGNLLLSLLKRCPHFQGVGGDVSEAALNIARENTKRLGLEDRAQMKWLDLYQLDQAEEEQFDLIICNPPYLSRKKFDTLFFKAYEPESALISGESGMEAYEALARGITERLLKRGGWLVLEVGLGKWNRVQELFLAQDGSKWRLMGGWPDSTGYERAKIFHFGSKS